MSTLTVRKLNVDLSRPFGRHWLGGDAYRTQLFNALSMTFPIGEQSFIDSVRAVPPERLADPALRAAVRDFIGQEASHRFVHEQVNAQLVGQGLTFVRQRAIERRLRLLAGSDLRNRLAVTCAFEHYTAVLSDGVLRRPRWLADAEPDMRALWSWHAVEESEHKSVAFDVYLAAGGGYWRRVFWYVQVSFVFACDTLIQTTHNLWRDGALLRAGTWLSAARTWFGADGVGVHLLRPALGYLSPAFHPSRHDNGHLGRQWLEQNRDAWRAVGVPATAGNDGEKLQQSS
jgi:predicted metal-dependent hydrolase